MSVSTAVSHSDVYYPRRPQPRSTVLSDFSIEALISVDLGRGLRRPTPHDGVGCGAAVVNTPPSTPPTGPTWQMTAASAAGWTDGQINMATISRLLPPYQQINTLNGRLYTRSLHAFSLHVQSIITRNNCEEIWEEATSVSDPLIATMHNLSTVFARWRQSARLWLYVHDSLCPPDCLPQTAAQSVQPFYRNTRSLPTDGRNLTGSNRPLYLPVVTRCHPARRQLAVMACACVCICVCVEGLTSCMDAKLAVSSSSSSIISRSLLPVMSHAGGVCLLPLDDDTHYKLFHSSMLLSSHTPRAGSLTYLLI